MKLLPLFLWLLSYGLTAQVKHSSFNPGEDTVFFVLPSYGQKIRLMEEMAVELTDKERCRMEKRIQLEKSEVDSFAISLQQAVHTFFDFSKFAFMSSEVYEDKIASISEKGQICFLVRRGRLENGMDALILSNEKGEELNRPFPYYMKIFGLTSFLDAFFGKNHFNWKDLDQGIYQWSKKLKRVYGLN